LAFSTSSFRVRGYGRGGETTPAIITGSPPFIDLIHDDELLNEVVTWGSYSSSAGSIATVIRQMRLGAGEWTSYQDDIIAETGQIWRVREQVIDSADNSRIFYSSSRTVAPAPAVAPSPFSDNLWAILDTTEGGQLQILISDLPFDGGSPITDIEYQVGSGPWISSGGTSSFFIDGLTNDQEYGIRIRAVNAYGESDPSSSKQDTPTLITVPEAFAVGDWDLNDTEEGGTLSVIINQLPFNGGSPITDVQYRVDSGLWVSTGGVSSFDISGLTNGVQVSVVLRSENIKGVSDISDVKDGTPTLVTVPSAFGPFDWNVEDTFAGGQLTVNILSLPDSGGATISDIEYQVSGGSWISSGGTSTFNIDGLTNGTSYIIRIRAVNAVGSGPQSGAKSETPTLVDVPATFDVGDWDLVDTGVGGELLVNIHQLPNPNGAEITDVEYRVDGGSWVSSGGIISFEITGLTDDVEYDVELRAVNSEGEGPGSDLKSEAPTTAPLENQFFTSGGQEFLTSSGQKFLVAEDD